MIVLATLSLFLGLPFHSVGASGTILVVSSDGQHGWHSLVTDGSGNPDSTFGSVTFVTGPGTPPLGTGSLRLQTFAGKGDGSAQMRNTNYAGVKLSDLTNLTYWAYSAMNNGQQFPYFTLSVQCNGGAPTCPGGTDILFFEPPYQSLGTGDPSCTHQAPTAMFTWQKWDALTGCWWDNNGELCAPPLGIGPCGGTNTKSLSVFRSNHPNAAIYNPSSTKGGVRVAVGFASSVDTFDGNVDALTVGVTSQNITYNFEPPTCKESDGNGDFHSGQGEGNFKFDGDGCKDGDSDNVQSTNRGDGHDFQSTQIDTIQYNDLGNIVTITGLGTSNGLPVAFVFIALETGPTTPGWVSFAFSDGYTSAGTLIDGSVLLH